MSRGDGETRATVAVRRAAARGFLPWGAGPALQRSWKVADMVWTAAGDTSEDYNRYSKRGLLAGVIPLVPGSRIYRGLLGLGDDLSSGAAELLGAAEIAVSIAAGVVLGQLLASRIMPYFRRSGIAYTPAISSPFTTMRRRRLSLGSRRVRRRRGAPVIEPSTMTGEMTALSPALFEDADLLDDLEPPADLVDRDRGERRDEDEEVP